MRQHQLLAILSSAKNEATRVVTDIDKIVQKSDLFFGMNRTYSPKEEEGEVYPSECKRVRYSVSEQIEDFRKGFQEYMKLAAMQDFTNCIAKADIVIDGQAIATDIPVTYLLFLEHRIADFKKFLRDLPTLPLDKEWHYDSNAQLYKALPVNTLKTKKVVEFVEASPATPEHPAQVKEVTNNVVEGTWTVTDLSGALSPAAKKKYLQKAEKLHRAVVIAREKANQAEVVQTDVADTLLDYVFETTIE